MLAMTRIRCVGIATGMNPLFARLTFKLDMSKIFSVKSMIFRFLECVGVMITMSLANCIIVVWRLGMDVMRVLVRDMSICYMSVVIMKSNEGRESL
jgi:hypothetical protein